MSDNYPCPVIATNIKPENNLNNLPFIQKEIKGEYHDILYNIKIFKANQSILFNINKIDDFSEVIYRREYNFEQIGGIDVFFKSFKDTDEIYI